MKKSAVLFLSVFMILLIIPVFAGGFPLSGRKSRDKQTSATAVSIADETDKNLSENINELNDDEIDYILAKVLEYTDENTNIEAVKAVIALCKNNFLYHKHTSSSQDEINIDTYSDEFLEELRSLYKETDAFLQYNNETVYIPITNVSPGYIVTDEKYPYIISVACPWDTFSGEYIPDYDYPCGISINSIGYLCEYGSDYIDALRWHLPCFDIEI